MSYELRNETTPEARGGVGFPIRNKNSKSPFPHDEGGMEELGKV